MNESNKYECPILAILMLVPCMAFAQAASYQSQLPDPSPTPAPTIPPTPIVSSTPVISGTLTKEQKLAIFLQQVAATKAADEQAKEEQKAKAAAIAAEQATWRHIKARVLQYTREGLLIDVKSLASVGPVGFNYEYQGALLRGFPEQDSIADDQEIDVMAKEAGTFQYTTVMNSTKTVKAYAFMADGKQFNAVKKSAFGPNSRMQGTDLDHRSRSRAAITPDI